MKVSQSALDSLKKFGFAWFKDNTTDKVSEDVIQGVIPAAEGFTVVYTDDAALEMSTVKVENIFFPADPTNEWIRVVWNTIVDQRRDTQPSR